VLPQLLVLPLQPFQALPLLALRPPLQVLPLQAHHRLLASLSKAD